MSNAPLHDIALPDGSSTDDVLNWLADEQLLDWISVDEGGCND